MGIQLALEGLVLRQKLHLLDTGSILRFSKTLAMTAGAQLCAVISGHTAVWRQQANPGDFGWSLTACKARAHQPESFGLFPVFFVLRWIRLYSGFLVF